MLSVRNMLSDSCQRQQETRSTVLNIASLLSSNQPIQLPPLESLQHHNHQPPPHMPWAKRFYYQQPQYQYRSRQHQIESNKIEQELLLQHHCRSNSSSSSSSSCYSTNESSLLKAKRKRASSNQLNVLNQVFERTIFPSTQLRAELGRQLGMNPRTVQIWFQNKRQAVIRSTRTSCI